MTWLMPSSAARYRSSLTWSTDPDNGLRSASSMGVSVIGLLTRTTMGRAGGPTGAAARKTASWRSKVSQVGDHGMQASPVRPGPLNRNIRCGADSHENLEPARLQWLRADLRGRYTVKASVEADGIGPPGGLEFFDVLGETVSAAAHRYVGGFELLSGPALSQAHDEPPAAEMIQRRQPTGEDDG